MIGGDGEEQLVDFAGKIGAIACRCNNTAFGVDANRNDNAAASLRAPAGFVNDFPVRQAAVDSEILMQPFRKCMPGAALRDFDRGTPVRIAEAHKSEVEEQ
jgi:hypothetical protein